jgi:hypothetical protein
MKKYSPLKKAPEGFLYYSDVLFIILNHIWKVMTKETKHLIKILVGVR